MVQLKTSSQSRFIKIQHDDLYLCACFRFMNDSKQAGTAEYIPERVFVVGGDESGSRTTCKGDSGSPVVRSNDHGHWEVIGIVRDDTKMTDIIGHLSP